MMSSVIAYAGLFWAAFLAATFFPAQSEAVLLALLASEQYFWWLLILVATTGNALGAIVNWFIGVNISKLEGYRWFPVSRDAMAKAELFYRKYGRWSLLLSWIPFIGDPLTIAAGVLRERFSLFVLLVSIAKLARYLAIAAIATRFV